MPCSQTLVSLLCTLVNIAVSLTLRLCYLTISTYAYPNKEDTHTWGWQFQANNTSKDERGTIQPFFITNRNIWEIHAAVVS